MRGTSENQCEGLQPGCGAKVWLGAPRLFTAWMLVVYMFAHFQRTPLPAASHAPSFSQPHFFWRNGGSSAVW